MVQKNAQKEYEKLSAQVNDLQNQVNDNQINIPSDTQTETENVAQEVQTEDSELEQPGWIIRCYSIRVMIPII